MGTAPPAQHSGPAGSPPRYLSLVHLMAGTGSPTELHGSLTSFIHGVVTVPPKEMILAGAWGQGGGQPGGQALCADPPVCAETPAPTRLCPGTSHPSCPLLHAGAEQPKQP